MQTYLFLREGKAWFLELTGKAGSPNFQSEPSSLDPHLYFLLSITGAFSHALPGEAPK